MVLGLGCFLGFGWVVGAVGFASTRPHPSLCSLKATFRSSERFGGRALGHWGFGALGFKVVEEAIAIARKTT